MLNKPANVEIVPRVPAVPGREARTVCPYVPPAPYVPPPGSVPAPAEPCAYVCLINQAAMVCNANDGPHIVFLGYSC